MSPPVERRESSPLRSEPPRRLQAARIRVARDHAQALSRVHTHPASMPAAGSPSPPCPINAEGSRQGTLIVLGEAAGIGPAGRACACRRTPVSPHSARSSSCLLSVRPPRPARTRAGFPRPSKCERPPQGWPSHFGGGGGNRTRVRKSSAASSTYLARLFALAAAPPTGQAGKRRVAFDLAPAKATLDGAIPRV
jgi:hypothetical protein